MRYLLILAFALVTSVLISDNSAADPPEVYMVDINPEAVDNQQDEDVSFNTECSVCNEDAYEYFFWNSSIDGVLAEGSQGHIFSLSSSVFSVGEHTINFQVRNNSEWSSNSSSSEGSLSVSGRDEGGGGDDDSIEVHFEIFPPTVHLGETVTFRACEKMDPAQNCVEEIDPDLDFNWEIDWNVGDVEEWSFIGDQERFTYTDLEEGTHTVRLTITYGQEEANASQQFVVLPPVPIAVIDFPNNDPDNTGTANIKEGENLTIDASCLDNNRDEIVCDYFWEIWDADDNPDLQFRITNSSTAAATIVLTNLTNSIGKYGIQLTTQDSVGTDSLVIQVFVNVLPPNVKPSATITISPDSVGGQFTPEYYQNSYLTFSGLGSNDPDGDIVSYKWYLSKSGSGITTLISENSHFIKAFENTGGYQIKLEVEDDSGVWSSKNAYNFKIITNTAPSATFTYSNEGTVYTFNSSVSDLEGYVSSYVWSVNGEIISNTQNVSWTAVSSGTFTVELLVIDDGGMNATVSQEITVKITEQKNFVASFSSKNLNVGDTFTIFFNSTGEVDYFSIKVNYPNGTVKEYQVASNDEEFSIKFDKAGQYPIDVQVVWRDGVSRGLDDFYGPTVNVGQDGSGNGSSESENNETIPESTDGLPSLSLLVSALILSLIAVSRRQR